jgi:minor extracellular serine protease Vpr
MDSTRQRAVWLGLLALLLLFGTGRWNDIAARSIRHYHASSSAARSGSTANLIVQLQGAPVAVRRRGVRSRASQQAAVRRLTAVQAPVRRWVLHHGGQVLGSFCHAYNGLWVQVPAADVAGLRRLPNVVALHPARPGTTCSESNVSFIGADVLQSALLSQAGSTDGPNVPAANVRLSDTGASGAQVRIGIIDTGLDYTHRNLGGPGGFPNSKVVGGFDFAGDTFNPDPNDPRTWTPRPDGDPIDQNGHGSYVAGVAAGLGVPDKLGSGVAPGALLYAYKVTGPTGEFVTPLVVQAIERAITDGVDVVNISLGTNFGPPSDPAIAACENASAAGIVVVAAAGNFGDVPYSLSSPAVAPSAIAVAASIDAGPGTFRVNTPSVLARSFLAVEGTLSRPVRSTGARTGNLVYLGRACPGDPLPAGIAGQVALIDRGICAFRDKLRVAQAAGAIGAVMINSVTGPPIVMDGDPGSISIPAVMVSLEDGARIRWAVTGGQAVNVTLAARDEADRLWAGTSRGPALTSVLLKPDLAAPGYRIFSTLAGSGDGGFAGTGTSAAAPHVAGAAALLRQLHPDWDVDEIKAVLMNTATQTTLDDDQPAPLMLQGAGRIRVDVAARTQSVALGDRGTASLSYGFQAAEGPATVSRTVQLRNKSDSARQYVAEARLSDTFGDSLRAVVTPAGPFSLGPGGAAALRVDLTFDPSNLVWAGPDGSREGFVILTETTGSGEVLRVPFQIVPRAASRTMAALTGSGASRTVQLAAAASTPSRADVYALGVEDPQDAGWEDDIRYLGVRALGKSLDDTRLEFAIATHHPWTTPDFVTFRVRIDVNEDGQYDSTIYNIGSDVFIESMAAGPPAAPGAFAAQIDPYSGVLTMIVRAKEIGLTKADTRFNYWAESSYGSESALGASPPVPLLPLWGPSDRTEKAKFDALHPMFRIGLGPGQFRGGVSIPVQIDASARARTPSPGLLVLYQADNPRARQAEFIPIP